MNIYPNNPINLGNGIINNPYLTQMPMQQPIQIPTYQPVQMPAPHMEAMEVNGRESANAFNMGPNSSVILSDKMQPKIWVVTTDASGFKAVNGMWVIPDNGSDEMPEFLKQQLEPAKKTDTDEEEDRWQKLNERLDKLEERIERYGKPDRKPSWQGKSGNANGQGTDGSNARTAGNTGCDVVTATNGGQ